MNLPAVTTKDKATIIDSQTDYSYNDFLRFELEQTYDIKEAKQKDSEKPFSPIGARLDFFPGKYVGLDATALWSVYDYDFISHNIGGNLWDRRGDSLKVEYRYTRSSDETDLNEAQSIFGDLRLTSHRPASEFQGFTNITSWLKPGFKRASDLATKRIAGHLRAALSIKSTSIIKLI